MLPFYAFLPGALFRGPFPLYRQEVLWVDTVDSHLGFGWLP
jgi:hypothetical protein